MAGDIKLKYLASTTLADSGFNSLAASTTRVAGYATVAVDCGGDAGGPLLDVLLAGSFTAGAASNNAGQIDIWVIGAQNQTPVWPSVFDGAGGTETVPSVNVLYGCGRLAASISGDSVNSRVYSFAPVSVASLFGGTLPDQFVVFVSHNIHTTTVAWAASGHVVYTTPVVAQYT